MIKSKSLLSKIVDGGLIVILIIIAITCILPLWYTLSLSLSSKAAAAAGAVTLWPIDFNFNSYKQLLQDSQFFKSFWISIQRVVFGAGLNFIIVPLMAYPLSKTVRDFKGRNVLMWTLVFTMLFNGGLIPLYLTIKGYGLMNSIWALVLVGGAQTIVFNIILTINFFRNLPKSLEEAALVDGAGPWYILTKVFIPLSIPVLATISLFSIVYHWNEFLYGLIFMTREEFYPLQTYIQQLVVSVDPSTMTEDQYKRLSEMSNRTLDAAKIFIAMIPVLVVYPFLQRYFIHGITLGSVKE
ncbi:carbohydrate ABC transporter permease [Lederbergia galactosidilytica]|uniref:ABC transporter permease n=1 Tax=Lederbergia galactosidilytica TaxID=217031 RepID=A0A177ZUR7_9BACI|nr:carbohydrate ABC transporter permease [Lederbergia galactosidilytica]KRG13219.1 ABC transporter permease [Virgibacillus soli]MBP1915950.1 multiple sugar transport system permease protein/putative aldouronate transport system permease protein [Lederbergia galactosidilytica]OAK71239.1 ABC transporter permease [Lederbergia galactosidilytica]